jgi:hypothetical protein
MSTDPAPRDAADEAEREVGVMGADVFSAGSRHVKSGAVSRTEVKSYGNPCWYVEGYALISDYT